MAHDREEIEMALTAAPEDGEYSLFNDRCLPGDSSESKESGVGIAIVMVVIVAVGLATMGAVLFVSCKPVSCHT